MAKERVIDSCQVVRILRKSARCLIMKLTRRDSREHISIYTVHDEPLFFQHFDEPFYPTLRLLHKCKPRALFDLVSQNSRHDPCLDPFLLPKVGIDRGAIRFLLAGAHMMCPGLTSTGGYLPPAEDEIPANALVAVHAEGKQHAVAVGITKLSTEEMRNMNKGIGVEIATYLGDDLWEVQTL
ncbi:PUA-like domain-containing protein [Chiua virens]|nr:PUA-like domain-containing protein [Chiua virens]